MEISLRPYEACDVDAFIKWANDEEVIRTSRLRHFTSKQDALAYIQQEAMPHPWYRAVCLDGVPIGFLCVKPGSDGARCRGELSYALGSKYWGQGITTLAVKMAIPLVFQQFPHMVRLQSVVDVDNKASVKVLEKAGFVKEGVLRKYLIVKGKIIDAAMYILLSSD